MKIVEKYIERLREADGKIMRSRWENIVGKFTRSASLKFVDSHDFSHRFFQLLPISLCFYHPPMVANLSRFPASLHEKIGFHFSQFASRSNEKQMVATGSTVTSTTCVFLVIFLLRKTLVDHCNFTVEFLVLESITFK